MRKSALLIMNPAAGKATREETCWQVADRLFHEGYDVDIRTTRERDDVGRIIRQYGAGQDVIVCCGGDGTFHDVAEAVVGAGFDTPIYHLPVGTTNDLARTLNLSYRRQDPLHLLKSENLIQCDVGRINDDRYFTYVAAFGAFATVSYSAPQQQKNKYGYLAYLMEGVKHFDSLKPYEVTVQCDDRTYTGKFLFGAISNTTSVAGVVKLPKDQVRLDDGKMEVMLIRYPENPAALMGILMSLTRGTLSNKHIVLDHTAHCEMTFLEDTEWAVDGEEAGLQRVVKAQVQRKAYAVYCGENAAQHDAVSFVGQTQRMYA